MSPVVYPWPPLCHAAVIQILGQLIYSNPVKVEKTLPTFKDAASRREDDADMWELLAELLASRDPAGVKKVWPTDIG